jgi:N,N-dimethylformamidase beta subunit-like protein
MSPHRSGHSSATILASFAATAVALSCGTATDPRDPASGPLTVAQENALPGDPSWRVEPSQWAPQSELAAWASPYAARPGDALDLFIHATHGPVTVNVYRLGWYGGAGSRLRLRLSNLAAAQQPPCSAPLPGPVTCLWSRTTRIAIGMDWTSGLYLIRVTDAAHRVAYAPFVLTGTRRSAFVGIVPQFTWQAYNKYGGSSLYAVSLPEGTDEGQGVPSAHVVSFERPLGTAGGAGLVFADFKSHELRAIRFLERSGYDITYASDLDLTPQGRGLTRPSSGLIFLGHDEYWTYGERSAVEAMRDGHTHLMFLSGNNAFWNVRLDPGSVTGRPGHVITCYKMDHDPGASADSEVTTEFRRPPVNRPENSLIGIMYVVGAPTRPLAALVVSDTAVGADARNFLADAGLSPGAVLPDQVAIEGDRIIPNGQTPPDLQVLFKSRIVPKFLVPYAPYYYTTFYVAPSGAGVFAAGDVEFGRGLDGFHGTNQSPALQQLVRDVLKWMEGH